MKLAKTPTFTLAVNEYGNPESAKMALLVPGRMDTKDYVNFTSHAAMLADKGYFVVAFDPPGTWESPGPTYLNTTTNYLAAINELIEIYGNKQTLLVGHSRGGAVAMIAASRNNNVAAVVPILASYGAPFATKTRDYRNRVRARYQRPAARVCSHKRTQRLRVAA